MHQSSIEKSRCLPGLLRGGCLAANGLSGVRAGQWQGRRKPGWWRDRFPSISPFIRLALQNVWTGVGLYLPSLHLSASGTRTREPTMPNIATVLKEEILRLARKELRRELEGLKKASSGPRPRSRPLNGGPPPSKSSWPGWRSPAQTRRPPARARPRRRSASAPRAWPPTAIAWASPPRRRASSIGVSAQTVYNWEAGKSRPGRGSWRRSQRCGPWGNGPRGRGWPRSRSSARQGGGPS